MATKGQKQVIRTEKEKYEIIKPVLENFKSQTQVSKETGINVGLIFQWIKKYNEKGMEVLKNKTKPGNPLSKYSNKKNLTIYLFRKLKIKNLAILVSWSERSLQIGFLWFMGHKLQLKIQEINL